MWNSATFDWRNGREDNPEYKRGAGNFYLDVTIAFASGNTFYGIYIYGASIVAVWSDSQNGEV